MKIPDPSQFDEPTMKELFRFAAWGVIALFLTIGAVVAFIVGVVTWDMRGVVIALGLYVGGWVIMVVGRRVFPLARKVLEEAKRG